MKGWLSCLSEAKVLRGDGRGRNFPPSPMILEELRQGIYFFA